MSQVFVNRTDDYYKSVSSAAELMDNELTVSHLFRTGNARFTESGLSYGETLAKKLGMREGMRILEVGPGLGDLAESLCSGLNDFHYTFIDISFDAIKNLKKRFRGDRFSFIAGDFLGEKLREKFDLIICNEVLADFPTIVNMTLYDPKLKDEDKDDYYDAVSLAKFYGLSLPKVSNFNYGAVKFLDKARALVADGGKIFVCEHASEKPARIGVHGHSEYTIDFPALEKVAARLRFAHVERGTLSGLLQAKNTKAVVFYMQPELKMLYGFLKRLGVSVDQKAYSPEEAIEALRKSGVGLAGEKEYSAFLESQARPLKKITDQFSYLILEA
jgi:cyclopropane fatty-acyl-phospholipid synthase-like methyltransferase